MKHTELKSSLLKSAGYDPATQTLELTFARGGTYRYLKFTQADFDAFKAAESQGKHFLSVIKPKFECNKCGEDNK